MTALRNAIDRTALGWVKPELDTLLGHPIQAGVWQQVVIPLASVGLGSGTVRDIYLQDDSGTAQGVLFFDDLQLVRPTTAPPPPPNQTSALVLYGDALAAGFDDWSWATHDMAQSGRVHTGTRGISAELDSWASLFFHSRDGIDLSRYGSIELWVHGGTSGGQLARLVLESDSGILGSIRLDTALGHSCLLYTSPSPRDS